jgi:hypothetical protein
VIGGILELVGVESFLGNSETMFEQADSDAAQWEAFLLVLANVFGGRLLANVYPAGGGSGCKMKLVSGIGPG